MAYIYEYIKRFYSKNINEGIFYDLGSGTGKAIIAMSLMHKFKKVIGLEYLENLIKLSQGIKQNYNKTINEIFEKNKRLFSFSGHLSDIFNIPVSVIHGELAMSKSVQHAENAARYVHVHHKCGLNDLLFFHASGIDVNVSLCLRNAFLKSEGSVGFHEGNHILFGDQTAVTVIILIVVFLNIVLCKLQLREPFLLYQPVTEVNGRPDKSLSSL